MTNVELKRGKMPHHLKGDKMNIKNLTIIIAEQQSNEIENLKAEIAELNEIIIGDNSERLLLKIEKLKASFENTTNELHELQYNFNELNNVLDIKNNHIAAMKVKNENEIVELHDLLKIETIRGDVAINNFKFNELKNENVIGELKEKLKHSKIREHNISEINKQLIAEQQNLFVELRNSKTRNENLKHDYDVQKTMLQKIQNVFDQF